MLKIIVDPRFSGIGITTYNGGRHRRSRIWKENGMTELEKIITRAGAAEICYTARHGPAYSAISGRFGDSKKPFMVA